MQKESKPFVSIIMPVLNGGRYFEGAINSVRNQSFRNIEIIIVDDGSTDGTIEVIRKCANEDSRIVYLKSNKKSMGYQYNMGINNASGEYIGFVEADDFISPDMYEVLYSTAKTMQVDIIKGDWYSFSGEKEVKRNTVDDKSLYGILLKKVPSSAFIDIGEFGHWSGIYRR